MNPLQKLLFPGVIATVGIGFSAAQTATQPGATAPVQPQQQAQAQRQAPAQPIAAYRASTLEGSRVDNHLGNRLGTVDDVLVDMTTGEVIFILVREGLTAVVGDIRPVPPSAFQVRPFEGVAGIGEGVVLILQMDEASWERAPRIERAQFGTLTQQAQARDIYTYYGQKYEPAVPAR